MPSSTISISSIDSPAFLSTLSRIIGVGLFRYVKVKVASFILSGLSQ
jgi:hypothetical protein